MIARIALFVKHCLPSLWRLVERLNGWLFRALHSRPMEWNTERAFREFVLDGFTFRSLAVDDLPVLQELIRRQGEERLRYFQPHAFDSASLRRMHSNPAFLMFGAFESGRLVGYFFLRCFWNRKCFVGRLIDEPFEGRGIGRVMNQIMYHTAWWSGFRCLTTISRDNALVMRSHASNPYAHFVDELSNNYMMVEFLQPESRQAEH